ncbi:MAG: ATP synthase subunit I [Deltaproteobacteria bacterium]|nr:ATP synthase subunit I [Deltaproteobacteria bacterium]
MGCDTQRIYPTQKISKILLSSTLTLIAVTAGVNLIMPSITGISMLTGGITGILNFYYLLLTVKRSMTMKIDNIASYVAVRYWMKFTLTSILIYVLVSSHIIEPIAFIVGFTLIVFNIVVLLLFAVKKGVV